MPVNFDLYLPEISIVGHEYRPNRKKFFHKTGN
jgi:hypothetical protein